MLDKSILEQEEYKRQEAHFHHSLFDFHDLIGQYGIQKVMENINEETYWILAKWFDQEEAIDDR